MKNIIESVIKSGRYELSDILRKISSLWVQGVLSGEEMSELTVLARNGAQPSASVDVVAKLAELEQRIVALENSPAEENGETGESSVSAEAFTEGKWYYNGDEVAFEGKMYKCIAPEGAVCVWSPSAYPTYWELID